MSTAPVFFPGETEARDVPQGMLHDAVAHGGRPAVLMKFKDDPSGAPRAVPADKYVDATKNGGTVLPFEDQPVKQAGFWHSLASDLKGMVTPGPGGGMSSPYPGVTTESGQLAWKNAQEEADSERKAGYSKPYMAAAGVARGLGVNVPGMEQSAKEGDEAGVLGHAAAVPAVMATSEVLSHGSPPAAKAAAPVVAPIVKAGLKTADIVTLNAATRIWNAWKTVPAEIRAKLEAGKPVFPGAPLPEDPGVFPGAPLPEHPGTFPGAPLPATPPPEVLNPSLVSPARTLPGQISPEVTRPPAPPPAQPIPARSGLQLKGEIAPADVAPDMKKLGPALEKSVGAKPLQRNVSLRDQLMAKAEGAIPEGHTAVDSSAVKSYKYDADAHELHVTTKDGTTYVSGEVTPAQAEAFRTADSKGQAWKAIRDNSPLVAKISGGKRIAVKPSSYRSATPEDEAPSSSADNLTDLLERSLAQARKKSQ